MLEAITAPVGLVTPGQDGCANRSLKPVRRDQGGPASLPWTVSRRPAGATSDVDFRRVAEAPVRAVHGLPVLDQRRQRIPVSGDAPVDTDQGRAPALFPADVAAWAQTWPPNRGASARSESPQTGGLSCCVGPSRKFVILIVRRSSIECFYGAARQMQFLSSAADP